MARGRTIRISVIGNARDAIRALRETRSELRETARAAARTNRSLIRNNKLFQNLAAPGVKAVGLLRTTFSLFVVVAGLLAVRMLLIAGALTLALPAVLHLTAAVAPLLGLMAGAPALLAGAAAGFAAFKVATSGVGDALQAGLQNNTELFAKKMALIPPAARKFVTSILAMRTQIRGLRATVSNAFFAQFAGQVRGAGARALPVFQLGLARVAAALGRLISGLITTAVRSKFLQGVGAVFKATARAIDNARPGIMRFLAALGTVFLRTAPIITRVGKLLGRLLTTFAKFLTRAADTGTLSRWFDAGWRAAGQLWILLRNVFSILRSILNAGSGTSGTTLLGTLDTLTGRLDTFFKSAKGQLGLKNFFDKIGQVINTIGTVMRQLLPVAAQVASYFTDHVLPAVESVVEWLTKHKQVAVMLLKVLAALYVLSKVLAVVAAFHRNYLLLRALLAAISANPLSIAVLAGALIGYRIAMAWQSGAIQKEWHHLWDALSTRARNAVHDWNAQFIQPTVGAFKRLNNFLGDARRRLVGGFMADLRQLGPDLANARHDWYTQFVQPTMAAFGQLANVVSGTLRFIVRNTASIGGLLYQVFLGPFLALPGALYQLGRSMIDAIVAGIRAGLGAVGKVLGWVGRLLHIPGAEGLGTGGALSSTSMPAMATTRPVAAGSAPVTVNVNVAPGGDLSEAGRHVVRALESYQRRTGRVVLAT